MKREIKFRGRDIDTGEFVYAELGEVSAEINPEYLTFITDDVHTIEENSIAQLVGYDKDGREIYEGDTFVVPSGTEIVARFFDNITRNAKLKEDKQ